MSKEINIRELKQIQLYRQHITNKAKVHAVCHDLNGIQAQFMVHAEHALRIRCREEITKDCFGDGLVKNWTVRGTVHIFNQDDLPVYKYARAEHGYRSHDWNPEGLRHCTVPSDRLTYLAGLIVDMVRDGITLRDELKKECLSAGVTASECAFMFHSWGGLLRALCERGFLSYKVQESREFMLSPPYTPLAKETAELEQARRYFSHYAPATIKDAAYYFGWTQAHVKEIMEQLPLYQTVVAGKKYFYCEALLGNYPDIPRCVLLAGFDQLMLGYQKKDSIYLPPENLRGIFNLAGIVMPAIMLDGVVRGRWRKKNHRVTFQPFGSISARDKEHVEETAAKLFPEMKKAEWATV